MYQGEPNWYLVAHTRYNESRWLDGESTSFTDDGGGIGADVQHLFPDNFGMRSNEPPDNAYYECVKVEQQACASDVNPVNIEPGDEFESKIDF